MYLTAYILDESVAVARTPTNPFPNCTNIDDRHRSQNTSVHFHTGLDEMGEEDPSKSPEDILRSGIKAFVSGANSVLGTIENAAKPVGSAAEAVKTQSIAAKDAIVYTYQRRHEFPVEIIGGSAVLGGGLGLLRRGRIAGLIGAVASGGAAYAIVYDEIKLEELPDLFFGKKN